MKESATYSVDGNYSLSDKRQKNFATIGEGEIIVRDGNADLSGLNRDVSIAQYETKKETGLEGSFRFDDTTVKMTKTLAWAVANPGEAWDSIKKQTDEALSGLGKFVDNTMDFGKDALAVAEKMKNFANGDGYLTDKEVEGIKTQESIGNLFGDKKFLADLPFIQELLAKEGEAGLKKFLDSKEGKFLIKIAEETGWDGKKLNVDSESKVISQFTEMASNKMPPDKSGCMYLSYVYAVADALGIKLTPAQIKAIYDEAKSNGAVGSDKKNEGPYYVNYPVEKLIQTVAKIANVDGSTIKVIDTDINGNDPQSREKGAVAIVNAMQNGNGIHIRYGAGDGSDSWHSMTVISTSYDKAGDPIAIIRDTGKGLAGARLDEPKNAYVNMRTMKLYIYDVKEGKYVESTRPIKYIKEIEK